MRNVGITETDRADHPEQVAALEAAHTTLDHVSEAEGFDGHDDDGNFLPDPPRVAECKARIADAEDALMDARGRHFNAHTIKATVLGAANVYADGQRIGYVWRVTGGWDAWIYGLGGVTDGPYETRREAARVVNACHKLARISPRNAA